MRKLTTILRTPEHITARTVLAGSFALADFALWCVTLCTCFPYIDEFLAAGSLSLPHGTSNPHGTRDEASPGRAEGARTGTDGLSPTPNQFSSWFQLHI